MELRLVPFEDLSPDIASCLAQALEQHGYRIRVSPVQNLPGRAFNPRRGQYAADPLLNRLGRLEGERVLGVTGVDLYRYVCRFVYGLADLPGRRALISHYRLGQAGDILYQRLLKLALHELGHCHGLEHCPENTCVMCFSASLEALDHSGRDYCPTCRARLPAEHRDASEAIA